MESGVKSRVAVQPANIRSGIRVLFMDVKALRIFLEPSMMQTYINVYNALGRRENVKPRPHRDWNQDFLGFSI